MATEGAEAVLDGFVEAVFKLIIEHHQRRVVELDLTLTQAQTLRILRRAPVSSSRLAAELRISPPAVTQLTDRLTRKQLIERQPVDGDRRMVLLSLTSHGRGFVDEFRRHRNEVFAVALGHLDEGDRAGVIDALRKVSWALGLEESGEVAVGPSPVRDTVRPPEAVVKASNVTSEVKTVQVPKRIRMEWD